MNKVLISLESLLEIKQNLKQSGKKIIFTNGCFDILHAGHVDYLVKAKKCGDILVVGLNSDKSISDVKGNNRPIINENERAFILSQLKPVDYVILFNEPTPIELISEFLPDILIKGDDWAIDKIVGREIVEAAGGEVKRIKFVTEQSTSKIIKKVISTYNE